MSFELAAKAFVDPLAIEWIDEREDYGEERTILLGMADGTILVVVYVERDERIRLISARRAIRDEENIYYRENDA